MHRLDWSRSILVVAVVMAAALGEKAAALADEPPESVREYTPGYSGFRARADAHALAEERRLLRLDDQLYLNDAMRARYGWPLSNDRVVWYGNAAGLYESPVSLDYAYAYAPRRLAGRGGRLYIERYWSAPLSVFEPWPYVPGDIYGYDFPPGIRQPIGQRQFQSGPTRWESHPVYADELEPAAPAAAVESEPKRVPRQDFSEDEERPTKKLRRRAF